MDESERPRELSPNPRKEESDPSASAIAQDATFYTAMRRAIEKGLEHAPIGNSPASGPHRRPQDAHGRVPRMGAGLDRAAGPSRGPRRRAGQAATGLSTTRAGLTRPAPTMVAQVRGRIRQNID